MSRALELVSQIYEAVVEPDAWHDFLARLSDRLGGAALQLSLRRPDEFPTPESVYRHRLDARYHAAFLKHALDGLPWERAGDSFRGRFDLGDSLVPARELEARPFYREYMQPQGLAPEWPLCHVIAAQDHRPLAGLIVYRREGCRAFDREDVRLLDSLVPHLSRAYAIRSQLAEVQQQQQALTEVIDRLPLGVVLVDAEGRVRLMNRSAAGMIDERDGIALERRQLHVSDPAEDRALQTLVRSAVREPAPGAARIGEVMSVVRPSGRRPLTLMVTPLLEVEPGSETAAARAALFLADPERGHVGTTAALEALYGLTRAEAELVRRVADGHSLEQVAAARNVSINTVRSQLKQVFAKTDTNRQGELVHLVLAGVAALRSGADREDEAS